jgi:hypothetical protein
MKNWKTTLIGLAIAGLVAAQAVQSSRWQDYVGAVLVAIFGVLAKDFNISGGSAS